MIRYRLNVTIDSGINTMNMNMATYSAVVGAAGEVISIQIKADLIHSCRVLPRSDENDT